MALRATAIGVLVASAILALVEVSALLPVEFRLARLGGVGLAALAGLLGNLALTQALVDRGPQSGSRFVRALVVDFIVLLVLGGGASLALFLVGAKFLVGATFALAFAAAAIVLRVTSAVVMSTVLSSPVRPSTSDRKI